MVAQVRPPPSLPANRLFFLVIAWGLIARSTMLESSSMRPSVRKRSKMFRREMAYRRASASLDFPETRGRVACQRVKRSRTIAAEISWRAATRASGLWPRTRSSISHNLAIRSTVSVATSSLRHATRRIFSGCGTNSRPGWRCHCLHLSGRACYRQHIHRPAGFHDSRSGVVRHTRWLDCPRSDRLPSVDRCPQKSGHPWHTPIAMPSSLIRNQVQVWARSFRRQRSVRPS